MIECAKILKLKLYVCKCEKEQDRNTIIEMLSTEENRSKLQLICLGAFEHLSLPA